MKIRKGGSAFLAIKFNIPNKLDTLLAVNTASANYYREDREGEGLPVPVTTPTGSKGGFGFGSGSGSLRGDGMAPTKSMLFYFLCAG